MKTKIYYLMLIIMLIIMSGCGSRVPEVDASDSPDTQVMSDVFVPSEQCLAATPIPYDDTALPAVLNNPHGDLSVPTYLTKIDGEFFIVDCYHNQVIYHDNLSDPLTSWQVMTSDINMGHTIASNGIVYLIDDTENNRILIMEKAVNDDGQAVFIPTQEFTEIGERPHYVIYDEITDTFYAWSSLTGEMFLFRHAPDTATVYLTGIRTIDSLKGVYVRSFTIIGNEIYFVSGNSLIIKANLDDFSVIGEYPVPSLLAGMIQITPIDDYYYITISTDASGNQEYATMIRTRDLDSLAQGDYEDVYENFIGGGTPYYITNADGRWYLTEHRIPGHSLWSFQVEKNMITDVISLY